MAMMRELRFHRLADLLLVAGAFALFFGCIATSYRSARTLEPGQVSVGAGYVVVSNEEDFEDDPLDLINEDGSFHLVNLDFRFSPGKNIDLGVAHTFDITRDHNSRMATVWGDAKVQLTNTDNALETLTLGTGLMKGYAYHGFVEAHFTSIPVMLSYPISERFTPTLLYRHEMISSEFLPTDKDSFNNPRLYLAIGFEYALWPPTHSEATVKIGASVGTFNHLSRTGDRGVTMNLGLTVDFPTGNP